MKQIILNQLKILLISFILTVGVFMSTPLKTDTKFDGVFIAIILVYISVIVFVTVVTLWLIRHLSKKKRNLWVISIQLLTTLPFLYIGYEIIIGIELVCIFLIFVLEYYFLYRKD